MRVLRGRAGTIEADREASRRLLEVAAGGEPAVRVWAPHRQVAFGRRDARADGYGRAREAARDRGFPPAERDVGGRAVAYDGETTLAFARAEPVADVRGGLGARYDAMVADVRDALGAVGVAAATGEPPNSFCPGSHSLRAGGKLAGVAQRVTADAAVASGVLVVDDREAIRDVLAAVYAGLDVPFEPASVGSVRAAGGPAEPDAVREALEAALVGDAEPAVEPVGTVGELES